MKPSFAYDSNDVGFSGAYGEAEIARLYSCQRLDEIAVHDRRPAKGDRIGSNRFLGERPALRPVERNVEQPIPVDAVQAVEAMAVKEEEQGGNLGVVVRSG